MRPVSNGNYVWDQCPAMDSWKMNKAPFQRSPDENFAVNRKFAVTSFYSITAGLKKT